MHTNQSLQDLFNISDNQITTYPVVINNEHKLIF